MGDGTSGHSRFVVAGALAGFAAVALVSVATLAPREAAATPAYSAQTKSPCGRCHVNPAGGGPRNAAGQRFEKNGHKF